MTDRDPRTDPRPGDVLEISGLRFEVLKLATLILYRESGVDEHSQGHCILETWAGDFADATIIRRAEDASCD